MTTIAGIHDLPMTREIEEQIRDLRALQYFILHHPDLPIGYVSGRTAVLMVPYVEVDGVTDYDQVDTAKVAAAVRMMKDGGKVEKRSTDDYMTYTRILGKKARIELIVERKSVCTARVVGTKTVVHAATPERTETIEEIEWDCQPILAEAEAD